MINLLLAIIYLAFISLGLPDSLLGAAWPSMYGELQVPLSCAGIISMIIAAGTILSSLLSNRLTHLLGTGKLTALSVAMTASALFGFSISHSFPALCLWAIPYGLGAGSVDASLNNYVALHYSSRHMSWLHCMWGIGATLGPSIMGAVLGCANGWNLGYRLIAALQSLLTGVLIFSLPLWNRQRPAIQYGQTQENGQAPEKYLPLRQVFSLNGAKAAMLCFFCYCTIEQTASLWASSYFLLTRGVSAEQAAGYSSLFFIGITAGRALSGFLTMKRTDEQMVRLGEGLILSGIFVLLLPLPAALSFSGLILLGLGCAPIYPCLLHATPAHFGAGQSQAVFGVQMASAYVGTCLMPSLFGLLASHISAALFPFYLLVFLILLALMHKTLCQKAQPGKGNDARAI